MKIQWQHKFEDIISVENLLEAWREFVRGKRARADVQEFSLRLMDNLLSLCDDLSHHTYHHGAYQEFRVTDPKPRVIHKAIVRDRLLHRALYRILYPFFDRTFVADSFSCRIGKGTHRALKRFRALAYRVSQNNTRTCWVLKGDIKKFFASIDHATLMGILRSYIADSEIIWLLDEVIGRFFSTVPSVGLPLGNLTSQLFANIYLNELDQFVKHQLKAKHYIRYADDFVIFSDQHEWLGASVSKIAIFLREHLRLELHP